MAYIPLVPGTMNATVRQGAKQTIQSTAVKDLTGAAVDLSTFFALEGKLFVNGSVSPIGILAAQQATDNTPTGDANGIVSLILDDVDLPTFNPPGAMSIVVFGKKLTGDSMQTLANGTINVQAGVGP